VFLKRLANQKKKPLRVAIIGASGGIGSALVGQLSNSNHVETIYALSRTRLQTLQVDKKAQWLPIDLLDEETIEKAANEIEKNGTVDVVIIASGLLHTENIKPEKDWRMLESQSMSALFAINTIGPALVMKHFAPVLPKGGRSIIAALSARVGSISDNRLGGWYSYRASKAALNQIIRTFSVELSRKNKDAVLLGLHPGTVSTNLSEPYQANNYERFTLQQSAEYLLSVIDQADPSMTGKVYDWKGDIIPE